MNIFWKKYFFSAYYRLILQNLEKGFHADHKLPERKIFFPPMHHQPLKSDFAKLNPVPVPV